MMPKLALKEGIKKQYYTYIHNILDSIGENLEH